jgi:hypothetical protein
MNIHQVSVHYVQEHDRVLVRVNTVAGAELRLWFTRRLTIGFLPLLAKVVAEHVVQIESVKSPSITVGDVQAQQMLADFKKEESLQASDFATPYKQRPSALPLGGEPLLVTEINMTPLSGGQLQLTFSEKLPATDTAIGKPRGFQMALEPKLTHGFLHLLEKSFAASQWAMPVKTRVSIEQMMASDDEIDVSAAKPKYLN